MIAAKVWWTLPPALGAGRLRELAAVLDAGERERAAGFALAADGDAFVAAHGLLRLALAAHAGSLDGGFTFSLAHVRSIVACAVTCGGPIGVDVEAVLAEPLEDELVAVCCAPGERALLAALPPAERPIAFARLWTLKEAVVKALGTGFTLPPPAVECALDPPRLVHCAPADRLGPWELVSFTPTASDVLAVARPAGSPPLTIARFD